MARPRRHPVGACVVTAAVMLIFGSLGLMCGDNPNAVFFGAFFPAILAGGIAYIL